MEKRMLCLLSILVIGALMLSSCGCIKETKEEPKKVFGGEKIKIPSDWKVYENEELGFKIKYPKDLIVPELIGFEESYFIVEFPIAKEEKEAVPINEKFKIVPISEKICWRVFYSVSCFFSNYSIDELVKNYLDSAKPHPSFRCEEFTNTTIDGFRAIKITVTYETESKKGEIGYCKEFFVCTKKGNRVYQLNYNSLSPDADNPYERYEKYLDIANQMTKSFQFV
jgi:hypothetical protein